MRILTRWCRPLYVVLALDAAVAFGGGLLCCIILPGMLAALILNRQAQNHIKP